SHIKWKPAIWIRSMVFVLVLTLSARDLWALLKTERLGLGVWRNYPEATVNFVKKHHIEGKIFNTYGLGGFLIWHLWPRVPVFIDGRTPTVYDQDFFWLYSLAERKNEIWQKLVKEYDVDIVLVSDDREIGYARLCNWLDEDERWRLVAFDDKSVLYLRKDSFPELTERWGFKYLRPSDLSMDYAKKRKDDEDFLRALGEELKEACRRFPRDFYPFYYLAIYHQIYGTEERLKEAVAALGKAIANRPHFARGYYELGFTLLKLKRYGEAVTALKKAISLKPDLPPDAYYYLGASYYQMGDIDRAIKALEKYKRKAGLRTRVEAYRFLGRAYLQKYKLRNALSCFKREAYLAPTWETYANMGIVYFGLQKLNSARDCFERAVSMNPQEIKVLYNLALTYEKLGLHDKAKEYFRRVAETKERSPGEAEWIKKAAKKIRGY
ncbi:MAG: tetratricopeptide repeat protein, partial [Candidatus Freyarchaeota archaeon]